MSDAATQVVERRRNWLAEPDDRSGLAPGGRRRLLERDAFLDELMSIFDEDWRLPTGPIVIEGRSGVGKTALLRAACQFAARAGWHVMQARASDVEAVAPYGLVKQLASGLEAHPEGALLSGLVEALADAGVKLTPAQTTAVPDGARVLVAVDDAHWADPESSRWLYQLARRLDNHSVRLVVAIRTHGSGPASAVERIASEPLARVMTLEPLGLSGVASIIGSYLGARPDRGFVEACASASGGYPFLLLALLNEASGAGIAPIDAEASALATLAPRALARSVRSRVATLEPGALDLLEAAAVLGEGADLAVACRIAGIDVSIGGLLADQLSSVDLLKPGRPLRFFQPVVRATVYGSIESGRLGRTHRAAAHELHDNDAPPATVARHLLAAEPAGDGWSAETLRTAGRSALERAAPEEALAYLRRASAELPPGMRAPDLLLELALAEARLNMAESIGHLLQAREQGTSSRQVMSSGIEVLASLHDGEHARAALGALRSVQLSSEGSDGEIELRLDLATVALGSTEEVEEAAGRALRRALPGTRHATIASVMHSVSSFSKPSGLDASVGSALIVEALRDQDLVDDDPFVVRLWARAIVVLALGGRFAEADRLARAAQTRAQATGGFPFAEFSTALAVSLARQGVLPTAESEGRRALSAIDGTRWGGRPLAVAALVDSLAQQGRVEEAQAFLTGCPEEDFEPTSQGRRALLEERGRVRLGQGLAAEALLDFQAAGGSDYGADNPALSGWRAGAASALAQLGRTREAHECAAENLEIAQSCGIGWATAAALRCLAALEAPQRRLELLGESVSLLRGGPVNLEFASALIDFGDALHLVGSDLSGARSALREGADLALRHGATPLVTQAAKALRATGARPRRLAMSGTEALTAAERRVVGLAADGLTNAEIASRLFINEKTVEGHLRRCYQKLGVRSRRQLGTIAFGQFEE